MLLGGGLCSPSAFLVVVVIAVVITFQTASPNWEGQKPKTRRPQQERQASKERENFRKKRKQQ